MPEDTIFETASSTAALSAIPSMSKLRTYSSRGYSALPDCFVLVSVNRRDNEISAELRGPCRGLKTPDGRYPQDNRRHSRHPSTGRHNCSRLVRTHPSNHYRCDDCLCAPTMRLDSHTGNHMAAPYASPHPKCLVCENGTRTKIANARLHWEFHWRDRSNRTSLGAGRNDKTAGHSLRSLPTPRARGRPGTSSGSTQNRLRETRSGSDGRSLLVCQETAWIAVVVVASLE